MPPSCALLGGFAIGARVVLLWQHNANAKCWRVYMLVLALCLVHYGFARGKYRDVVLRTLHLTGW